MGLYLLYISWKKFFNSFAFYLSFISVFVVFDSKCIVRNFNKTESFIPLAATLEFQDHKNLAFFEIKDLSSNLGLSMLWFDIESPVHWYLNNSIKTIEHVFPDQDDLIFKKLIIESRVHFINSYDTLTSKSTRQAEELLAIKKIKLAKKIAIKELSFPYLTPRFKLLMGFLDQPNTRIFHHWKYPFNVVLVFLQSLILLSGLYLGLVFSLLTLLKPSNFNKKFTWVYIYALSLIFYLTFILQFSEHRDIYYIPYFHCWNH